MVSVGVAEVVGDSVGVTVSAEVPVGVAVSGDVAVAVAVGVVSVDVAVAVEVGVAVAGVMGFPYASNVYVAATAPAESVRRRVLPSWSW